MIWKCSIKPARAKATTESNNRIECDFTAAYGGGGGGVFVCVCVYARIQISFFFSFENEGKKEEDDKKNEFQFEEMKKKVRIRNVLDRNISGRGGKVVKRWRREC